MLTELFTRKRSPNVADREWMSQYLQQLVGRFKNLPAKTDTTSPSYAEAQAIVTKATAPSSDGSGPTWDDVYRLDLALVGLEPLELVKRRKLSLEAEYRSLVSAQEYEQYTSEQKALRDEHKDDTLDEVRATIQNLMHEVQWAYIVLWTQEEVRRKHASGLVKWLVVFLVMDLAVAFGLGTYRGLSSFITITVLIMLTGALGALTSTLRRVQMADLRGNSDVSILTLERSSSIALTSAVLGVVFSVLLYLLFAGGLLQGALFPDVAAPPPGPNDPKSTPLDTWNLVPKTTLDYAKLLVWSFIAGFAERLVPGRLEQLSKESETPEKGK